MTSSPLKGLDSPKGILEYRAGRYPWVTRPPSFTDLQPLLKRVPDIDCPECEAEIAMHELETKTIAQSEGFETNYVCPYCGAVFEDVSGLL